MKKQFQNLNLNYLSAIFLASMFGSLSMTIFLQNVTESGQPVSLIARIVITFAAIVIFAAVVWTTFYVVVPEYRPTLRRLIRK
jgi:hypothetical protein